MPQVSKTLQPVCFSWSSSPVQGASLLQPKGVVREKTFVLDQASQAPNRRGGESMRAVIFWMVAIGVVIGGLAEDSPVLGPFSGVVGADGTISLELKVDFVKRVTGRVTTDVPGATLAGVPFQLLLEGRPGLTQILGVGNIVAVWLGLQGYDWERVLFTIVWDGGNVLHLGEVRVFPAVPIPCPPGEKEVFMIVGLVEDYVIFLIGECASEVVFNPIAAIKNAKRVHELPEEPGKRCTRVVVEKREKNKVILTFYHSDGKVWVTERTVELKEEQQALPEKAKHCEYFILKGKDGKMFVYHWYQPDDKQPGRWWRCGEYKPLEEKKEPEVKPPEGILPPPPGEEPPPGELPPPPGE